MKEILDIRQPIVEGLFYPQDPIETDSRIKDLLKKNPSTVSNSNKIVVPHGGWDFVGDYIALGFNSVEKKDYKKVVIISNVHREKSDQVIVPEYSSFLINNKEIKIDRDSIKRIKRVGKKVTLSNIPHMEEHSIEVVLPFISTLFPEAKIIPVLLGKTIVSLVRNLSNILTEICDQDTLIIVTSNFSDYRREDEAKELGERAIELVSQGKMAELVEETRTNRIKACGAGAIASLILQKNYTKIEVLRENLSKGSPLSGGRGTYYGTISFQP